MRVPDYVEPRVGWRVWNVVQTDAGARLTSLVYDDVWPLRDEVVAWCRLRERVPLPVPLVPYEHAAPHALCSCGIHASCGVEMVVPYLAEAGPDGVSVSRVAGLVAVWGEIVEGAHGWRASRGYPVRLYIPESLGNGRGVQLAVELGDYGVPIEILDAALPAVGAVLAGLDRALVAE